MARRNVGPHEDEAAKRGRADILDTVCLFVSLYVCHFGSLFCRYLFSYVTHKFLLISFFFLLVVLFLEEIFITTSKLCNFFFYIIVVENPCDTEDFFLD